MEEREEELTVMYGKEKEEITDMYDREEGEFNC